MEAVCKTCNLSLKLPQAALPAGARLFCPKCSTPLEIRQDAPATASQPPPRPQAAPQTQPASAPPAFAPLAQPVYPQPAPAAPAPGGGSWGEFLAAIPSTPPPPAQAQTSPPTTPQIALGIPAAPSYPPSYPSQSAVPQGFQGIAPSDRMTIPVMPAVIVPQPPQPPPSAPPAPARPATATEQLFSEDLVPDTEGGGEEMDKVRQSLFVKADSVWYGAPDEVPHGPPPTPSGPPKIPAGTAPIQQGYIKATDSIQVDPSLFEKKEFQAGPPPVPVAGVPPAPAVPGTGEGRMELDLGPGSSDSIDLAVTVPPHPAVSPVAPPSLDLAEKPAATDRRHTSGPIKLVPTAPKKQFNITVPAIVGAVLLIAAGIFFISAGHLCSSTPTKEKFDLASNVNRTGVLPSASASASVKPSTAKVEPTQVAAQEKAEEKAEEKATPEEKAAKVARKAASAKDAPAQPAGSAPKDTGKKAAQEHYSLGNQYFMQQRFDMSAEEYKAAIRADSSYAYAYRGLGAAYARLGKADLAVKQYEMYIRLVPNAPDAEQVKKIINDYYGK